MNHPSILSMEHHLEMTSQWFSNDAEGVVNCQKYIPKSVEHILDLPMVFI